MLKHWIQSIRLRTLPLSLATIGLGSVLAFQLDSFNTLVFSLTILTAVLLQILSNLSNDYGDFVHGADSDARTGPSRTVQSGKISPGKMRLAIGVFVFLSLLSGSVLLYFAQLSQKDFMILFGTGVVAILAAMAYTLGKKPYGYRGFGDFFVFLFFGLIGVLGTCYLQSNTLVQIMILPAISCGLFITAVLNINNIRDIESDTIAGKRSIPVIIGEKRAKLYHAILLLSGWVFFSLFSLMNNSKAFELLYFLSLPLFVLNGVKVFRNSGKDLDPMLKQLALSILLFVLLFGLGEILSE